MTKEPCRVKFTPYRRNLGEVMLGQTSGGSSLSSGKCVNETSVANYRIIEFANYFLSLLADNELNNLKMETTTTMVNVRIDASKPAGRKILRELEGKKSVELEYPMPDDVAAAIAGGKTYTHEEVWKMVEDKLNAHYGTNYKLCYND
jgi:hypothetical protein